MVSERQEHKAYDFWFLFEKFNKDLKRVNVKRFLLPDRFKTRAYFGSSNNGQKLSKRVTKYGYHSLPFAVKVSVRSSFEQFRSLNKRQGSFPHHSIPPCN